MVLVLISVSQQQPRLLWIEPERQLLGEDVREETGGQ